MINYKIKKSVTIYKFANLFIYASFSTCVKCISSVKLLILLSTFTKLLIILIILSIKTLLINNIRISLTLKLIQI